MLLTRRFKQTAPPNAYDTPSLKSTLPRLYCSEDERSQHSLDKSTASSKNRRLVLRVSPNKKYFPQDFFGSAKQHSVPKLGTLMSSMSSLPSVKTPNINSAAAGIFRMLEPLQDRPSSNHLETKVQPRKIPLHKLFELPNKKQKKAKLRIESKENELFELTFSMNKLKDELNFQNNRQSLAEPAHSPPRLKLRKQSARRLKYKLI